VGAGDSAALAGKALLRAGVGGVVVANRSLPRARKLAEALLCLSPPEAAALDLADAPAPPDAAPATRAIALDDLPEAIDHVDVVICSTGSRRPVLTFEALAPTIRRARRPLLIVDLAVPRDVDPRLGDLDGVLLYTLDDLDRLVADHVASRRGEISAAEAIVREEAEAFGHWLGSLRVTPTIKLLRRRFDRLEQAEIDRYARRFPGDSRDQVRRFASSLCNKIAHQPIAYLRRVGREGRYSDRLAAVDTVRRMFALDELSPPAPRTEVPGKRREGGE
jgi:glutamyl-tRNA reductase